MYYVIASEIEKCIRKNTSNPIERTVNALHFSKATVKRIKAEHSNTGFVTRSRKLLSGRTNIVADSFTEGVIRRNILQYYADKEYPTLAKLHTKLQSDNNFPRMGKQTLRKIMKKQLKMKFIKYNKKPIPFDREDIAAHRCKYLRQIRKFRQEGYTVINSLVSILNCRRYYL